MVRISGAGASHAGTTQMEREARKKATSCEQYVTATNMKAVFHNEVHKKFQPLEAACFRRAKEVWDFFSRHRSVGLKSEEILELKEQRTALKEQFTDMEESWSNLMPGSDFNTIFVKLTELLRAIVETVDKALLDREQPPLVGEDAGEIAEQDVLEGDVRRSDIEAGESSGEDAGETILTGDAHRGDIGQYAGGDLVEDTGMDVRGVGPLEIPTRRKLPGSELDVRRDGPLEIPTRGCPGVN